jgi:hypothetical protein
VYWVWVHCSIYKGPYNVSNTSYWNSPLHYSPPSTPPLISGTVSAGIIFTFTYMCIHCLHHIHPPTPFPTPLPHTSAIPPRQNLFWTFCSPIFGRKNIKNKMRNLMFLLVWDKDSYTRSFLLLFSFIHVLLPQFICLFQSSSLFPSPFPIVAPESLKFLYSFLHCEHINHTQVFGFLPLSYPSLAQPPLSVTHVP